MPPPRYQSDSSDASPLGTPLHFEFSGRSAKNRFMKAAMAEHLSSWSPTNLPARGIPSKPLINVYKRWGSGGFGQIVTGNIMIACDQLEGRGSMVIPPDSGFSGARFDAFKALAAAAKAHGSLIVGQLNHPGRQVEKSIQVNPISASNVQLKGVILGREFAQPHEATTAEIASIINGFAFAAEYLEKAGYDGIELHGAHGYLLAQFLSPTTNQRTDKYGGSLENRIRLIIEIAAECQKRVSPSFIIGIKINSVEFQEKGFSPEEARVLCQALESARFDYVELSGGTYESFGFEHKRESTKKREAFFLDFAEGIVKPLTKTRSYITGGFKSVGAMVKALDTVDGVGLARPVCQEFHLPKDMLKGRVDGAIRIGLDENNYNLTAAAAGMQIRQVGNSEEPIDLSVAENIAIFQDALGLWAKEISCDKEMTVYGYPDLPQKN
ncbi:FMN-linked oxidoreductase [Lepidopterella palustris CBS 459.81]|uniref:FMN-linked oxidoreductase n=1 Tax=Lepidopterella palustris CBS 459.81 TaxID=1314670 RepID=A0A8E2JEG8_9PEZI|nr:FMN-linked oxidoreductase [Lepidopterella palustris CBS 459.81]